MSDLYWGWVSVTSRCHTWLKKRPVEANELSNDEKAQIVPSRSILRCRILDRENDHTYLEMLYGLGDWWIDDNHWDGLKSEPRVHPYSVSGDLFFLKDFPYFYQDPEKVGDSHIFTFAMCLKYLKTPGINGVMDYLEVLNKYGESIRREAHVQALADFGMKATFTYSADPEDIKSEITKGKPVAASLLSQGEIANPTKGTHLVAITGYGDGYWLVQDPFGQMDLINGLWSDRNPLAGKDVHYNFDQLNPRLFASGGASGWCWLNFREI